MTWHIQNEPRRRDYRAIARTRAPEDEPAEHYGGDNPMDLDELVDQLKREQQQ